MAQIDLGSLEEVACYLCGSIDTLPWATENGFEARRCAGCKVVYVTPRPRLETIDEATLTGNHTTDAGELNVTGTFSSIRQRRLGLMVRRLFRDRIKRDLPLRWLDVGSGHGELLLALKHVLPSGSLIIGVEPNVAKREGALARGATVVATIDEVPGPFDVLSLMNVYSHLPDPVAALDEMTRMLEPEGGELFLETGNAAEIDDRDSYPGALDLPDHLSFTGEPQLQILFDRIGLTTRQIYRARLDGFLGTGYHVLRHLSDSSEPVSLPYRSPFRDLFVVAGPAGPRGHRPRT